MKRLYKLTPIVQRLRLYGFAVVMIHPACPIRPYRWGITELQAQGAHGPWAPLLAQCFPFRSLGLAPVISPSLRLLLKIRMTQPKRPLIYARSAFDADAPTHSLRKLITRNNLLSRATASGDGFYPLYWGPCPPATCGQTLMAYANIEKHPLQDLAQWYQAQNPNLTVSHQEDGQPLLQLPLFERANLSPVPEPLLVAQRILDCRFLEQYARLPHRCYIIANSPQWLAWFRNDCIRLLGPQICLWGYPQHPDEGDPLQHFILTTDRQIRFQTLQWRYGILHLDGERRHHFYRSCRISSGHGHWVAASQAKVGATYNGGDALYQFVRTGDGWYSAGDSQETREDASSSFEERVNMLARLSG